MKELTEQELKKAKDEFFSQSIETQRIVLAQRKAELESALSLFDNSPLTFYALLNIVVDGSVDSAPIMVNIFQTLMATKVIERLAGKVTEESKDLRN